MLETRKFYYVDDLENEVNDLLLRLGVDPSLDGFRHLTDVIMLYGADKETPMVELYENAGALCNKSGSSVERCCRHAIKKMVNDFPVDRYASVLLREPDYDAMTGAYNVTQFVALAWLALMREQSPV